MRIQNTLSLATKDNQQGEEGPKTSQPYSGVGPLFSLPPLVISSRKDTMTAPAHCSGFILFWQNLKNALSAICAWPRFPAAHNGSLYR